MLPNALVVPYQLLLFELKKKSWTSYGAPCLMPFLVTLVFVRILLIVLVVLQHLMLFENSNKQFPFHTPSNIPWHPSLYIWHPSTSFVMLPNSWRILLHLSIPNIPDDVHHLSNAPTYPWGKQMLSTMSLPSFTECTPIILHCPLSQFPLSLIVNSHLSTFPCCLLWSLTFFLHWSN
jgi:hypothetical protein